VNIVLIRIIEIALCECRFGGSENALIIHSQYYTVWWDGEKNAGVISQLSDACVVGKVVQQLADYQTQAGYKTVKSD